jgi:hypothetical protein
MLRRRLACATIGNIRSARPSARMIRSQRTSRDGTITGSISTSPVAQSGRASAAIKLIVAPIECPTRIFGRPSIS